jgi:hypothetical protein
MVNLMPPKKRKIDVPNTVSKYDKIQEGLGIWTSFYRENPHRFAIDYLNMAWLKPFQQILLVLCFKFTYMMVIASRGMGKSQIVAAVCCIKCILYPGIKICIAAGKRGQSINVLNKILEDFMPRSNNLKNEISKYSTAPSEAFIIFRNGSTVKVVTAADSARSARAHIIIADEFVQIKKSILDKVIRKFKAGQRTPEFYNKPEYKKYPKEPNTEIYISSAFYKYHYSWAKFKSFFKSMIKSESYFCCGFPYQLPVREGYYPEEQIREEMQEDDFDSIAWSMEMDSLFFGASENAFFSFDDIDAARKIKIPFYPIPFYSLLHDSKLKYISKTNGEIRILCMDIATAGGNKNDATCFAILQLIPTESGQYIRNVVYLETLNGGHTFDQSIRCRQLYTDFEIDFIVVDTNGIGIGVFDNLVQEQFDDIRNITYPAWNCINDEKMAERCKDQDAPKIIYSIKATQTFNSDCAVLLRDYLKRGKVRLLDNESNGNDILNKIKSYQMLSVEEQVMFQSPYYQTTALVNEMVNLDYELTNGKIKVKEVAGMRKDRYTAVSYANYIASEIERDMRQFQSDYTFRTFIN